MRNGPDDRTGARGAVRRAWIVAVLVVAGCGGDGGSDATMISPIPDDPVADEGWRLIRDRGCLTCHAVGDGVGRSVAGAPDLGEQGLRRRGVDWHRRFLRDPAGTLPGATMPAETGLTDDELTAMATVLDGLGTRYRVGIDPGRRPRRPDPGQ